MINYYVNQALLISLMVAGPVVLVTTLLGFVLGILQAVFQLQDQALPFGIKLVVITFILIALGPWIADMMIQFTQTMFNQMAPATRAP